VEIKVEEEEEEASLPSSMTVKGLIQILMMLSGEM